MTYEVRDGWLHGRLPGPNGSMIPVERFPRGASSRLAKVPPLLCLHTTEGREVDGVVSLGDAYKRWEYPPNFAVGDGKIVQLFPLGYASKAVDTKDAYLLQVEIAARVGGKPVGNVWLPAPSSLEPLVALMAFLHDHDYVATALDRPNPDWPVALDRGPQAVEGYYRRNDGTWPKPGVYGHVEIPDDEHWDPGSLDYPRLFDMVRDVLGPTDDEEDDAMFEEWHKGFQAHEDEKPFRLQKPEMWRLGWRDRERLLKDAVQRVAKAQTLSPSC